MKVIQVRNVNSALHEGILYLAAHGHTTNSRNGPVRASREPVTTVYLRPEERVFFHPARDANPFFHLYEALWMLAGRNDLAAMTPFVARFKEFSDDGSTLNGAYGDRWRTHFGYDQLLAAIDALRKDPLTRRVVVQMWDGAFDLKSDSKDLPCNTNIYFSLASGAGLDMTVCNRSNDIVWGAYGANAVHMSMLQEFMAGAVHAPMRYYWQVSNNYHCYASREDTERLLDAASATPVGLVDDRYAFMDCAKPFPMWTGCEGMDPRDYLTFVEDFANEPYNENKVGIAFLDYVARPMMLAHQAYKRGRLDEAFRLLGSEVWGLARNDWHIAGREWLARRLNKGKVAVNEVR